MHSKTIFRSIQVYTSLIIVAVLFFAQVAQALTYDEIVAAQTSGKVLGATTYDYALYVTGGSIIQQGKNLHLFFETDLLNGAVNANYADLANLTVSGLPAGTDIRFTYPPNKLITPQTSTPYAANPVGFNSGQSFFDLETTNATPLGSFTVTYSVTSSVTNITHSVQRTYNVVPASFFNITKLPFPAAVPIPQFSQWEKDVTDYGTVFCNPANIASTGVWEGSAWYYDGERAFFQIGDYTGNHTFYDPCAKAEQDNYQPLILGGRQFPGYEIFTKGMRMNYERNHDANSQAAVYALANDGYGTLPTSAGNVTDSQTMRELSYAIEAKLDAQAIGHAAYPDLPLAEDALLGQLDQVFIAKQYAYVQPFMVGLASEALIQYYNEYNPDPRIPYILSQALDTMWNQDWDNAGNGFHYRCYMNGCYTPSGTYWPVDSDATLNYNDTPQDLGDLIAPAYAWVFLQTGDPIFRQRADAIFSSAIVNSGLWSGIGGGKQFTQNFRLSFDYVKYRQQANALASANPPPDTIAPTVSVGTPAAGATVSGIINLLSASSDNVGVTGVQFKIDGKNAGTAISSQPFQTKIATHTLSNGTHTITATAYDAAGNAGQSNPVSFNVSNPVNASFAQCPTSNIPTGAFQGCYYNHGFTNYNEMYFNVNGDGTVPPPANLGTLVTTVNDPAINFNWGTNPMPNGMANSFFGVIWQGNFNLNAGTYTFNLAKDAITGFRVYVDGEMEFNHWWAPLSPTYQIPAPTFSVNFIAPATHLIRIEMWRAYTNTGDSIFSPFSVTWSQTGSITPPPPPAQKYPRSISLSSLEGLSAIPSNQSITATVLSGSTILETQTLTPVAGKYTVSFLSSDPQVVDIKIAIPGYLSAKLINVDNTINSSAAIAVAQLYAGDFNNDNTINALDFSLMNAHYNQNFASADINKDGLVNSLDFAVLKNNWNRVGQ